MFGKIRFLYRAFRLLKKGERQELDFVRKFLQPGMTAFDIGVYKGVYSYWFAKSVGHKGKVGGFEPQPKYYTYTSHLMKKLKFHNYAIENIALSNFEGESVLTIPLDLNKGDSWASLENSSEGNTKKIRVSANTLDTYCSQHELTPDLVKCDVEGHEMAVFQGSESLIKKGKTIFLFECEEKHLSEIKPDDVFNFIKAFGYSGYYFDHQKGALPFDSGEGDDTSSILENSTRNFLFVPKERISEVNEAIGKSK